MQKVEAVRTARQDRFHEARMRKAKVQQAAADRKQLEQEIHLVKAPGALAKEKAEKLKGALRGEGQRRARWLPAGGAARGLLCGAAELPSCSC